MDLWVVAAAAGAGYIAKYWQNLSGEKDGFSESSSGNSIHRKSESRNLLQQIRDQTCPFHRMARKGLGGDVSSGREDGFSDAKFHEMDRLGGGLAAGDASTSGSDAKDLANGGNYENNNVLMLTSLLPGFQGTESFQENEVGITGKNEVFDNSDGVLPKLETNILTKSSRPHRSTRSRMFSVKPLKSLESCLTSQLYREQARKEEYVFSSLQSPSTPTVRPLLVTDGNLVISRASTDSFGSWDDDKGYRPTSKGGIALEENNNTLLRSHSSQLLGSVELPRKPEQRCGKEQLSSSGTRLSGGPFYSQGSSNEMLLFFIGITIGIMSAVIANKREVDNLNELLKQTENLVRDLHEEIEMKDMLTVKELAGEDNQSQETINCSSCNREPIASSSKQESVELTKHNSKEPDDQKVENHELMSKIEAELEAELEKLELNMKASTSEWISDFVELNPNFEAGSGLSESDSDGSGTSTDHTLTADYAVSPRELSLRLHEVIETRLKARINELEAALQNSQKKVHTLEWQHKISQRGLAYGEVGSSSTPGSPNFINEVNDMYRPLVINLSGEALDKYNKAYEEIIKMTDTDQDMPNAVYDYYHIENDMSPADRRLFQGQNKGHNGFIKKSGIE